VLAWWARAAVVAVLGVAVANWVGWATGVETLTRLGGDFPYMPPWTALCLAVLGVAIGLQTGRPSGRRVWVGRALAVVVGVLGVVFLKQYATNRSFGLDQVWFPESLNT